MRQVEKPIGEPRLFIGLLVDNSGTMMGKKIEEARKTIVFFARVCREMGIPLMTATFGDDAEMIKSFKQDFNNPSERIKPKIIDATDASGGSTNMHAGIKLTIEAMNEERRKLRDSHGLIFVISDGQANAGLIGDSLRTYIEENRGRLTFKGFGLSGSDSERSSIKTYLNNYFGEGNCAYPEGFDDLPDEAFRVLRVNLMQFQQYLR
jgi:Mg-chelatase subunit ChlD